MKMKDNFNKVYLGIISECNENSKVITEGFGRWLNNKFTSGLKGKSKLVWDTLKSLIKANNFGEPFSNKSGNAKLWKGTLNGKTVKLKMSIQMFDALSQGSSEKEIPIYVIVPINRNKKEVLITWSDTEDDMMKKFNKALNDLGIDSVQFKSSNVNRKEETAAAKAKEKAEKEEHEKGRHTTVEDDDYENGENEGEGESEDEG